MREIKFRVWDCFNAEYTHSKDKQNLQDFFTYCQKCINGGNELILEQFTGLKDENGVEVFEGDILAYPRVFPQKPEDTPYAISKVEFEEGCYNVGEYGLWEYYEESIVIGNVHENPELLK